MKNKAKKPLERDTSQLTLIHTSIQENEYVMYLVMLRVY